jgi:branched-chain amino acid transport system permease protein
VIDAIRERPGPVITGVVVVAFVAVLFVTDQEESLVNGLITGSAYGLLALGLVLIYKSSGVFNFAQGEFGTVAIYVLYLLHLNDVPYGFAMLGALVVAVAMGLLVERVVVRPLFDAPRVILLVATAGVALLAIGLQLWFGTAQARPIDRAFPTLDRVRVNLGRGEEVVISDQRLLLVGTLVVLAVLLALFFRYTNLGLAILAASQEPTATELVGISVRRLSAMTWGMAALLGGLAGIIAVPETSAFGPGVMTFSYLIPAFTAAVLGGMTSLPGAFIGGVIVGMLQSLATTAPIFDDIPGSAPTLVVFVVLLAVLIIRPKGLLGRAV